MDCETLLNYIGALRIRASYLRGDANKNTRKALETAERVLKDREPA